MGRLIAGRRKAREFHIAGSKWLTFRVPFNREPVRAEVHANDWFAEHCWVTYEIYVSSERDGRR